MGYLTAPTTRELQARIIDQAQEETLILTSGRRLARRLRHAFRTAQIHGNRQAWLPPRIVSLNTWLTAQWYESWPEEGLASDIACLTLWKEAVRETTLPDGLQADLRLYCALDETYTAIIRHKLLSPPQDYPSPLISWRQRVIEFFENGLRAKRLIHPAALPVLIGNKLKTGSGLLPRPILCVGFESPAPVENDLLACLLKDYAAAMCFTELRDPPVLKAASLPDMEQEVLWLAQEVLEKAQATPLHRIGVVVPNMKLYAPLISRVFQELLGSPAVDGGGNFNLSLRGSLLSQPLVQAALLPLRLMVEGEKRTLCLALLLSPYYGLWSGQRNALAQADLIWRQNSIPQGLHQLLSVLQKENPPLAARIHPPGQDLADLLKKLDTRQTGASWLEALHSLWKVMYFPVLNNEQEEAMFEDLQGHLRNLACDLGKEEMDAPAFYTWLKYVLDKSPAAVPGHQEAGIQVIGLIESRGLSFDHLYVAGLLAGSLPQPVRHFPFLTKEEKNLVQGGTVESQYLFAHQAFSHLMTVASTITLTRPLEEKGDPLPPSPFWPESEENPRLNYWLEPGPAHLRARWLYQAHQGWRHYAPPHPPEDKLLRPLPLPATLSVTDVEKAISCPFKFFANAILGLTALDQPFIGIPPLERGNRLHRLLARFTRRMRQKGIPLADEQRSQSMLKQCMAEVLADVTENHYWSVEEERWSGLLTAWLSLEKQHASEGWRWFREEADFADLQDASWPFAIRGRIDRIDVNDQEGKICCWDYKTGRIPSAVDIQTNLLAPQLPLYLLALRKGKISLPVSFQGLAAGYIGLKSEGEAQLSEPVKDQAGWHSCLLSWEEEITLLGRRLVAGNFPAHPKPVPKARQMGACEYCPYPTLCSYWKKDKEKPPCPHS